MTNSTSRFDTSVFPSNLRQDESFRILVVRPDRMGDVILSTPVFEVIKRHYSKSHLTLMAKQNLTPILNGLSTVDHFMNFDPKGSHAGIRGFFRLYTEIRRRRFRIAVVLQSHWKIATVLFLARIKYRVGPLSKLHSFIFYNRGVRQRRSQVEMHETDYNLQLLRGLGIRVGTRSVPTRIHVAEKDRGVTREWLEKQGWNSRQTLVLVHPGMGGSALNWPESHYLDLIRGLVDAGHRVLVTGGPLEGDLVTRFEQSLRLLKEKVIFYKSQPQDSLSFFSGLCTHASLIVAPSTGPLHLAVALRKRVLTFYPPIRVQSALRWGPYLSDESRASVFVPEVYCGQDFRCLGSLCNYFPCMKSLTVKQALEQAKKQLELFRLNDQRQAKSIGDPLSHAP